MSEPSTNGRADVASEPADKRREWVHLAGPVDFALAAKIGLAAWPVLMALKWFARHTNSCYPSVGTLAGLLGGVPQNTIRNHLRYLENVGAIVRDYQRGQATVYHLIGISTNGDPTQRGISTNGETPSPNLEMTLSKSGETPSPNLETKEYSLKNTQEEHALKKRAGRKRPAFAPPTLQEVTAFCAERKNSIDAEHFVAHYTANGWKQGNGRPIVDWRAAVVTWERNQSKFSKQGSNGNGHHRQLAIGPGQRFSAGSSEPGTI